MVAGLATDPHAAAASPEACTLSKMTRDEAGRVLRGVDAVCFDVDSTVITVEGIDEYAGFLGVGDKVAELTAR